MTLGNDLSWIYNRFGSTYLDLAGQSSRKKLVSSLCERDFFDLPLFSDTRGGDKYFDGYFFIQGSKVKSYKLLFDFVVMMMLVSILMISSHSSLYGLYSSFTISLRDKSRNQ